ncbi:caspase-3-like isoform X2 [Liolophura sinensis]|uniref:caspase-3-like isoform X2 n=1 Tax=Liolophura sinensis TaxID=3198878 RepID=UPI003158E92A
MCPAMYSTATATAYHRRDDVLIGRSKSPTRTGLNVPLDSRDAGKEETRSGGSGSGSDASTIRPGAPCDPNEYNFNYKRRGVFLVINNKVFDASTGQSFREGSDLDAERLEERFQALGFEVRRYDDLTANQMSTLFFQVAAEDHSDADCFGCAILTHGKEGRVYGKDGMVGMDYLVMPFKGDRCTTLVGKPKLFFVQACRGFKLDRGADVPDKGEDDTDSATNVTMRKIPVEADFFMAYSTVPGHYSWRNNQDGSWFIQALCLVLENQGAKLELQHMMTQVNRMVAYDFESCTDEEWSSRCKQMPSMVSMLTRYVYFKPKKNVISS